MPAWIDPTSPPEVSVLDDNDNEIDGPFNQDPSPDELNALHENTTSSDTTNSENDVVDIEPTEMSEDMNLTEDEPADNQTLSGADAAALDSKSEDSAQETSYSENETAIISSNETTVQAQNLTNESRSDGALDIEPTEMSEDMDLTGGEPADDGTPSGADAAALDSKSEDNSENETETLVSSSNEATVQAQNPTNESQSEEFPSSEETETSIETELLSTNETTVAATTPQDSSNSTDSPTVLDSYDPSLHPVMDEKPSSSKPVIVRMLGHILPEKGSAIRAMVGGVRRSKYLLLKSLTALGLNSQVAHDEFRSGSTSKSSAVLLLVDFSGLDHDCHSAATLIDYVLQLEDNPRERKVLLVDYSGSWEMDACPAVEELVGKENIRFAQRNLVRDRYWDDETQWVNTGMIVEPNPGADISGGPVLHMPRMLRESFVYRVGIVMESRSTTRPFDGKKETGVAHFWKRGSNSHYTMLRHKVSDLVAKLGGSYAGDREIIVKVDNIGEDVVREHNLIHEDYVEEMLSSKIIVVAQRDEYEDHFRIWESLASGALVMTDSMLGLPSSFVHQENIVIYESAQDLEDYLMYYLDPEHDKERLKIAKRGWEVVMGQHRSWHRIEAIVFGSPLTHVKKPYDDASFLLPEGTSK